MIGKVEKKISQGIIRAYVHLCKVPFNSRTIIPPEPRHLFREIELSKARRGKTKRKKRGKKRIYTNRRQCATRVKIISAKIEEGREIAPEDPRGEFLFATFRRCNFYRQGERKYKIVSKSVLRYYLYS